MKSLRLLVLATFFFQVACATIVKSERTMVTFNGGLTNGETRIDIPDGQYSTKNGSTTILVTRSRQDIPITVTCNDQSMNGVIRTSYDPLAGFIGSLLLGGLIGIGVDAFGNKTYDPPSSYNVSSLCLKEVKKADLVQQDDVEEKLIRKASKRRPTTAQQQ